MRSLSLQFLNDDILEGEVQFGMELEFMIPNLSDEETNKSTRLSATQKMLLSRDHTFHFLAGALQSAGFPSAYIFETPANCPNQPLRTRAPSGSIIKIDSDKKTEMRVMDDRRALFGGEDANSKYCYWLVKREGDVVGRGEFYPWISTELNTPILSGGGLEVERALGEVSTALRTVHDAHFRNVHINQTCGLHVHVSPVGGMTALHAKRLCTLVFLVDHHLLFQLCSPHRRTVAARVSAVTHLANPEDRCDPTEAEANLPRNILNAIPELVHYLWTPKMAETVMRIMRKDLQFHEDDNEPAFRLAEQHLPSGHKTMTFEFRHAQASFSKTFVSNWIGLILTLSKVAFLPTNLYKKAVSDLWDIVGPVVKPEDAWLPIIRALNTHAPQDWPLRIDESFWAARLKLQAAGYDADNMKDGTPLLD